MLEFQSGIPEEIRRQPWAKHLESQRNFDGIPLEYLWNTAADFVQNYRMFFRIIPMKYDSFFWGKNQNSCGIFLVFWWNFCGILMEFQSKKQCERSYIQNLTGIFAKFFIYFFILLYLKRAWKKPSTDGT